MRALAPELLGQKKTVGMEKLESDNMYNENGPVVIQFGHLRRSKDSLTDSIPPFSEISRVVRMKRGVKSGVARTHQPHKVEAEFWPWSMLAKAQDTMTTQHDNSRCSECFRSLTAPYCRGLASRRPSVLVWRPRPAGLPDPRNWMSQQRLSQHLVDWACSQKRKLMVAVALAVAAVAANPWN